MINERKSEVMTYVTKPETVQAIKWTGENEEAVKEFGLMIDLNTIPLNSFVVKSHHDISVYPHDEFRRLFERKLVWDENI